MSFTFDVITIVVAACAVWYARNAVTVTKRQNDIALFEKRIDIYHGLLNFNRAVFSREAPDYSKNKLVEFETPAHLSEFYFSSEIHSQFMQILHDAHANRGLLPSDTDLPEIPPEHFVERISHGAYMEHKKLAIRCRVLTEDVRLDLRERVKQRS